MKIHELPGISVEQLQTGKAQEVTPKEDQAAAQGQSAVGSDVIHLSPQAKLMQKAAQAVAEAPEIRPEKVLVLKDSVEQGTYKVDTQKVADKLIVEILSEKP